MITETTDHPAAQVDLAKLANSTGRVSIHIEVSAEMNFSAVAARQRVMGYVVDHISTQLRAGEPVLLINQRLYWQVPVILSLPPTGDLGEVGNILVDVETGNLNMTPTLTQEIVNRATELAARPYHPQQQRGDCLAACAAMVLGYVDVRVNYGRLLRLLHVTPFGTSGPNLLRLRTLDIEVAYEEGSMESLTHYLDAQLPCITLVRTNHLAHWPETVSHAVVVVGMGQDNVYIHDPAYTEHPLRVSAVDFELAWMYFNYRYGALTKNKSPRA